MRDGCPFCDYDGPNEVLGVFADFGYAFYVIEPIDPVVEGHLLVVPKLHVESAAADWKMAGLAFGIAAAEAKKRYAEFNLITSVGRAATQTVKHLHVHVVPRRPGDGLALPWSSG